MKRKTLTELPPGFGPGRVFRTRDLVPWTSHPSRLLARLIADGTCKRSCRGLYGVKIPSKLFGLLPPDVLRVWLDESPYLQTGPHIWNALGLGSTQLFAVGLIYNRKRSGRFNLRGRPLLLRRRRFPIEPCVEWYVVDLLENLGSVCLEDALAEWNLACQLKKGIYDASILVQMAREYGSKSTRALVRRAVDGRMTKFPRELEDEETDPCAGEDDPEGSQR